MEVPEIFAPTATKLTRQRARYRMHRRGPSFLLTRCAEDAASRIADINRQFERALLICDFDLRETIKQDLPKDRHPLKWAWQTEGQMQDLAQTQKSEQEYDLIINLFTLQTENDLPGALIQCCSHLKSDGLLMATLFGGESLRDLRQSFYHIDQALFGGATARIFPMIDHQSAAALLGRAGFNLPVIDKDFVRVNYKRIQTLIEDLRDLGMTNVLTARHKAALPKHIYDLIEAAYPRNEERKFPVQFDIFWLTGWTPHESQQKPLKPGSAKMSLAKRLRDIRDQS